MTAIVPKDANVFSYNWDMINLNLCIWTTSFATVY